ncbi:LysR substrate-binding domain-containing protein [Microbaculum marinum]|uniref:LysR substrate-binding domain-containing protein n=1 Tax=Microbaculum marinum TaxID=1764581 RepID=A0AAW9RL88_9HYPH
MKDGIAEVSERLSIRQLRTVVAIEAHGSIRVAAETLNITQPTATKSLKEAEKTLGVELFIRTNRGVLPTAYGTALCRRAKLILAELRHAGEDIRDLQEGLGGRVVVGTLLAASARLLPLAIARVRKERPKVSISVVEGTNDILMPSLRLGDLDLVVGRLPEYRGREETVQEVLYDEETCMAVRPGHPLLAAEALDLADTIPWGLILPPQETTLRRQLEKTLRDSGIELAVNATESISVQTNRQLTLLTDAISVWPYQVVRQDILDGKLARLPVNLPQAARPVGLTMRARHTPSPAAAALIDALRAVGAEIREESLAN